ncbi:MAG: methyltransferase domain-containing protein [Sulfurimonas sp.]|uniref:class I SAM-dependent methyltransferase n=1 Tax=Sulfurimonas sp. TaxID=2022749 RepID=UPI00261EDC8B|nr:class I SAM-dependent methyltransferase [Sulfurimonas sp.]MDD5373688.1 methyltransferase domain-containing protein [Sulfurimonas sp.]
MIPFNYLGFVFKHLGSLIYPKEVLEELCIFLKPFSHQESVLDVGAGTGVMSEFAYKCNNKLKYVAVDPAEGMLKFALPFIETYVASAEELPFEDNSFDVVLMGESLHHFYNPSIAFQEVKRVLKKDGKLFIYDFDVSTFRGKSICMMEKLFGEPAHFYKPSALKEILEEYGFSVNIVNHKWRYTVSASLS